MSNFFFLSNRRLKSKIRMIIKI